MSNFKSKANSNWLKRLWSNLRGRSVRSRRRLAANRLRLEQLESRRVFAAILLDIPGMNGDATVAGATPTDIELTSFSWGFSRGQGGASTSPTTPLQFNDLTFQKKLDSATNDLYSQANFSPINSKATKLRIVDTVTTPGKTLLNFDLTNARVTSFSTKNDSIDGGEAGSLAFSKVDFTESFTATNRTASWNLLDGTVTKSAIAGAGNVDVGVLNAETVLEIDGQKLLIDDFEWSATNDGSNPAAGKQFKITRDVDSGTAGLLGSAAAGTTFSNKVTITDRRAFKAANGDISNKVVMEWNLYNASISDFGLSAGTTGQPTNTLGLSYSKIELKVIDFSDAKFPLGQTLTTVWDEANKVVTPAASFGTEDPTILSNSVSSYLDFGSLGKVRYDALDWSLGKSTVITNGNRTTGKTTFSPMSVELPAGASTPALLGVLASKAKLTTVAAKEQDKSNLTSALDTWTLTNAGVSEFAISSQGLEEPTFKFSLDFDNAAESYNDRNIPRTTVGNFNEVTQTSTGTLSFGERAIDTEFELVITAAGKTSEIPVNSANWSVGRTGRRGTGGGDNTYFSEPSGSTFDLSIPRGIHSPGLFMATAIGTKIDKAVVSRYKTDELGNKTELYRWELTDAFLTSYSNHMLPGNSTDEVDSISLTPTEIILKTVSLDKNGSPINASAGLNFFTSVYSGAGDRIGKVAGGFGVSAGLQFQLGDAGETFIESLQWGAALPIEATKSSGDRPLGNPDVNELVFTTVGLPSTRLLFESLASKANFAAKLLSKSKDGQQQDEYEIDMTGTAVSGYSYSDKLGSTGVTNTAKLFADTRVEVKYQAVDNTGQLGTARTVDWNLVTDATTLEGGFGGNVFPSNQAPATVLEFFDGTTRSQVSASGYAFGTDNKVVQPVGKPGATVPLTPRGNAVPGNFVVETRLDLTSPALIAAIAQRTKLPEIKITERRMMTVAGQQQYLPYREWVLKDVYVEKLDDSATALAPFGAVELALNPGSATSTLISFDKSGVPVTSSRLINFVAPPTSTAIPLIAAISTDPVRTIDMVTRFTDEQEASANLRYSAVVVSGASVFDSVTLNSLNRLLLDFKAGQSGFARIRVDATDAFGLVGSLFVDVAVDVDGITAAPAGTNMTVTINEDTPYTITAADFGFTDPNDFPANTFTSVTVASLPPKGSLTLNNVAVALNQTISIANINAGQLKYIPSSNENGTAYSSFQFQVRDNGSTNNIDLSPNTLTVNVIPVNDAPVITVGSTTLTLPSIGEDSIDPNGALLTSVGALISDVDAGALKGIAVFRAETTNGNWQFALDGITWQTFGTVSASSARLLAVDATTRIRFAPNANFNSASAERLGFYAWDQTTGTVGATADVQQRGATTAFGLTAGEVLQFVTPVNDAPILNTSNVLLPSINEDTANPTGVLVSTLLTGMSDIDAGAVKGMAVRGVQNSNGNWQFSLNNGATWTPFGSVTPNSARLLPANTTTRVRFVADANYAGNRGLSFHAWDRTSGNDGDIVDLTLNGATGGSSAVSTDFAFAILTITAINDAPVIASPSAITVTVNTPIVFSTANGNALSVSDVDVDTSSLPIEVQFVATKGRFALSTLTGITVTVGANDSSDFTIRGSVASINAALSGAIFTPTTDTFGAGSLRLVVNDLGNIGIGSPITRIKSTAITIDPLPVATDLGTLDQATPSAFSSGLIPAGQTTSIFYRLTLATATDVRMVLSGLTLNADLFVATTSGLPVIDSRGAGTTIEDLVFTASPGSYIIRVKAFAVPTVSSSFNLSVSRSLTNDDLLVNAASLGTMSATTLPTVRRIDSAGGPSDIQDYYKFTTTAASGFRLNVSGLTDDLDVQLLNSKGVLLRSSALGQTAIETIVTSNLAAGDYFIRVFALPGRNVSSYDLSVSLNINADDSISRPTALGTPSPTTLPVLRLNGLVGGAADIQDYYSFVLAAPTDVRINLTGLSTDVDLQLLDRFGRAITGGNNSSTNNENVLATQLPAGTYYVRVYPVAANTSSLYDLVIAIDPSSDDLLSNAAPLGLSSSVATVNRTGSVALLTDGNDYYQFTLATLANVRINLSGMSSDADLQLEDAFGRLIASSTRGNNAIEDLSMTALPAGTYYVRVSAFAGATNYLLSVTTATTTDDLISNATVLPALTSGTLPTARTTSSAGGLDIQDYYQFQLNTAGNLRLNLSNMTTDLDVEILDQFGQMIVFGAQSGNTIERVTTPVLSVGTYYIRVFQLIVGGPGSNYNLEISTDFNGDDLIRGGTPLGTLAATPLTANGTVGGAADIQDYFSFTTTTTRNVRFLLTGLSGDVDIQILDTFGRVVASGTSGSVTTEDLTVNALVPGSYFIRIFPFTPTTVSNYLLTVS